MNAKRNPLADTDSILTNMYPHGHCFMTQNTVQGIAYFVMIIISSYNSLHTSGIEHLTVFS